MQEEGGSGCSKAAYGCHPGCACCAKPTLRLTSKVATSNMCAQQVHANRALIATTRPVRAGKDVFCLPAFSLAQCWLHEQDSSAFVVWSLTICSIFFCDGWECWEFYGWCVIIDVLLRVIALTQGFEMKLRSRGQSQGRALRMVKAS
jgi:hypothetical protein